MVVEAIVRMFSWPSLGFCGLLWAGLGLMLTGCGVRVWGGGDWLWQRTAMDYDDVVG